MPREFCCRSRLLSEFWQWKATEFRQLLYLGPVVFYNSLSEDMYQNFVMLSVSLICMLHPNFVNNAQYCDYV